MTSALWEVLITSLAALFLAGASWLHSQSAHNRVGKVEDAQRSGLTTGDRVCPRKDE